VQGGWRRRHERNERRKDFGEGDSGKEREMWEQQRKREIELVMESENREMVQKQRKTHGTKNGIERQQWAE
jgi:hypothetical protein